MNRLLAFLTLLILLAPASARAEVMTSEGLDQVLAPIALYPDSLLGNVLVGATYPDQIVEADQWAQAHPNTPFDKLDSALSGYNWDNSVKALVAVPDVLRKMAGDMAWTNNLGTAFVNQTNDVYDSIQRLRAQAQGTGALASNGNVDVVTDDSGYILIGSSSPDVIYVPVYDPYVVYGWRPGAVVATTALVWGTVAILNNRWYGSCWDWNNRRFYNGAGYGACGYYNGNVNVWGGNRNVNINNNVNVNIQNNVRNSVNRGTVNWKPGTQPTSGRWDSVNGYGGAAANRAGQGNRQTTAGQGNRQTTAGQGNRPATTGQVRQDAWGAQGSSRMGASQGGGSSPMFQDRGSGAQTRAESQRGSQVRQSSPYGGGGGSMGGGGGGGRRGGGGGGGGRRR